MTFALVNNCRAEYGKPFVLLGKRKFSGGYFSSLFDMPAWIFTALLIFTRYMFL